MLILSFALLSAGVCLGLTLLGGRWRRMAVVHGWLGGLGLAAFWLGFRAMKHPSVFGWDVAFLLAGALAGGLSLAYVWAQGRRPGIVVFLHASAGGMAYLLLAGFAFKH